MQFRFLCIFIFCAVTVRSAQGEVVEWRQATSAKNTWGLMQALDGYTPGSQRHGLAVLDIVNKLIETQPRAALQYLNQAYSVQPLLPDTFNYYKFRIYFRIGERAKALELGTKLLKQKVSQSWEITLLENLIELNALENNHKKVLSYFSKLTAKFGYSKISTQSLRFIASAYQATGKQDKFHRIMENLAAHYPHTSDARWAFHRLVDLSCEQEAKPYVFSTWLLKRLSWNTEVYPGLKSFILGVVEDRPVRLNRRRVGHLDLFDQLQVLMSMRFYNEAESVGKAIMAEEDKIDKREYQRALELLAKNAIKMGKPKLAAEYFSTLLKASPNYTPQENYSLADAFRYLNKYNTAYEYYQKSSTMYDKRYNIWQQFWMAYRAANYDSALEMLGKHERYIESRDRDGEVAPLYWRAKIYEKQGRTGEADDLYAKILSKAGQNYYSSLVLRKKPGLLEKIQNVAQAKLERKQQPNTLNELKDVRLASLSLEASGLSANASNDLGMIKSLIGHDLRETAKKKIKDLSRKLNVNENSALALHKLLNQAGDFEPRISLLKKTDVLSFGSKGGVSELALSQASFNEIWQVYYPKAYWPIVSKYTAKYGVEGLLLLSVMRAESYYREEAASIVGAKGLVQIMPFTGIRIANELNDFDFKPSDLANPRVNIAYGSYYLNKLLKYYDNNVFVALAAYNAGPKVVNFWLESCGGCDLDEFVESIPYRETRRYVKKVSKYHQMYQNIYRQPTQLSNWPKLPEKLDSVTKIY